METYQLEIFMSLLVLLGAAFVALICDFLNRHNELLRELAIELKLHRENEQRAFQAMNGRSMTVPISQDLPSKRLHLTTMPAASSGESDEIAEPVAPRRDLGRKRAIAPAALAVIEKGEQLAASMRPRMASVTPQPEPERQRNLEPASPEILVEAPSKPRGVGAEEAAPIASTRRSRSLGKSRKKTRTLSLLAEPEDPESETDAGWKLSTAWKRIAGSKIVDEEPRNSLNSHS